MAQESTIQLTYVAGGTIVAKRFVALNGSGQVVHATADADAIGVTNVAGTATNVIEIQTYNGGVAEVEASGAITAGDPIAVDTNGQAQTADTAGQVIVGYARTAAAAANEVIEVVLVKSGAAVST